jgi:hypothetical protein
MADLEKAAAQAEKENKDLFIVYRGAPGIRRHTACRNGRSSKSAWQGAI